MNSIHMVGHTSFKRWSEGMDFEALEGATLLGERPPEGRLVVALYSLKNGDFCNVTGDHALYIHRRDFPRYIADEGCPWEFTETQLENLDRLIRECQREYNVKV